MRRFLGTIGLGLGLATAVSAAAPVSNADFDTQCAFCHQTAGAGLPGQFPRLAGRVNQIAQSPEGRQYLAQVLLFGMAGPIVVDGKPISGFMTPFNALSDAQVSGILNYLAAQKPVGAKAKPFTPAEIAKVRAGPAMTGTQVYARHVELAASKVIQ